jgi:hypothetical protein
MPAALLSTGLPRDLQLVTERAGDSHPGFDWYPAETMGTHHAVSDLDQKQMAFRLARITNLCSGRQEPKIDHADRL